MKSLKKIAILQLIIFSINPVMNTYASKSKDIGTGIKYEKILNEISPITYSIDEDEYAPQEVIDKQNILMREERLKNVTVDKYEIALAYADGSYEFVESTNSYDEAISKSNSIGLRNENGQAAVSAVINSFGAIIYSPNGVGRARQYVNGVLDVAGRTNTDLYTSSDLNSKSTYINHLYVEDVALINQVGDSAHIQVGANTSWVKSVDSFGTGELDVIPVTQYTNPSYYYVEGGVLKHFISNDVQASHKSGSTTLIGPAPKELIEGREYLSFDGIYFYEVTTNSKAYVDLVTDLRNNEGRVRAVNKDNPHYSYYNYLPFRTKSQYTAEELNRFIEENTKDKPTSKLKGLGKALKDGEEKYGVNAILTLGVAINESGWGMSKISQEKNNLFGIRAYDSDPTGSSTVFDSPGDSVIGFTKHYISKGYCDPNDWRGSGSILGNKDVGVNIRYASDPYWGEKAASLAFRIDYFLSNKNVNNLKDYNNYQLVMVTGENTVYNEVGEVLYSIGNEKVTSKGILKKGTVQALRTLDEIEFRSGKYYKVNPDRKDVISFLDITGDYDFNVKGYLNVNNTVMMNKAKDDSSIYVKEDFNSDEYVDILDLNMMAVLYNTTSSESNWDSKYDLNKDNIVDIFDLIRVAKKFN